jgi:Asp-tRNA(Asn)/Glu-tRNA(Gln) amidotransferase A subunit family amidase
VSPDGTRVYVANGTGIDVLAAGTRTRLSFNVDGAPFSPQAIALSPDGEHAYIGGGTVVLVLDTATNAITHTNRVLESLFHGLFGAGNKIAITPDGSRLYVAAVSSSSGLGAFIDVIDAVNHTLVATVNAGLTTENAAMHGKGHVPPLPGSRGGFVAMACVGPLARTMADIELAWRIINRPVWKHCFHLPQKPRVKTALADYRIAWFEDVGAIACGDETKRVLGAFLHMLESGGVKSEKRPFDDLWLNEAYAVWGLLFGSMAAQDAPWIVRQVMKRRFSRTGKGSVINVQGPWKAGLDLRFKDFSRALKRRVDLVRDLQRRFDEYDFIISPVAAGPAFRHNPAHRPIELDGRTVAYLDYAMPSAIIYNACGNPALVVPAGRSASGLPVGIQIAAPHYAEAELIHFGKLIEQRGVACARPTG